MSRAPVRSTANRAPRRSGAPKMRVTTPQRRRPDTFQQQVGRAIARLPIPRDLLRRVRNWTLGLLVAGGIVAGIIAMGVPQLVGLATAHALGRMGFVVRNIQIEGRSHVDADAVYAIVMEARGQDMPLVDLSDMRDRLIHLGWIGDARVSRRLPDTLVVSVVERRPAAILQRDGRLSLIDTQGHVLAGFDQHRLPMQLPLVIGWGVENQVAGFQALIAGQPALGRLVTGGTWVGDRRWDVRFQSGEILSLPEGAGPAHDALATFARKDRDERLLGRGYVHFDMRIPGQLVVRTSREPGARVEDPQPASPPAGTLPPNAA